MYECIHTHELPSSRMSLTKFRTCSVGFKVWSVGFCILCIRIYTHIIILRDFIIYRSCSVGFRVQRLSIEVVYVYTHTHNADVHLVRLATDRWAVRV